MKEKEEERPIRERRVLDYRGELLRKFRTALADRNWDVLMLLGEKLRSVADLQKRGRK